MNVKREPSKAVVVGSLLRVDVGNVNAGWTEGVVTVLKKVQRPDGLTHPYISGQALRRYIRDTLADILPEGGAEQMSPAEKTPDEKAPVVTAGDPEKYIDDDLFGFMKAVKGGTKRRESPLRVSPAFGIFPYAGDRDLGTRSAVEVEKKAEAGGSIFETEVTNNVFRTTMLLELDRVGKWLSYETTQGKEGEIPADARKRRVKLLLEALKYLWGGGRKTRFLVDVSPQFVVYCRIGKKIPLVIHALDVRYEDSRYWLETDVLRASIADFKSDIHRLIVGVKAGFLANQDLAGELAVEGVKAEVLTMSEAVDRMIGDIDEIAMP
jgi:CRISPR-associated protein Cst2